MRLLHNIKMVLGLSCRHASVLLSRAQDGPLTFSERLALRMHLLICGSCRRFNRQLSLIRQTLRAFMERSQKGQSPVPPIPQIERDRILTKLVRALRKKN